MPVEKPPFRAAVVGTGAIVTGSHLPALRELADRVRLVAAVDIDRDRLAEFCAQAGDPVTGYATLGEMLDAEHPDLVLIGTPPALHAEQVRTVLRSGAWALCEKPLCLSLEEFDRIAGQEAGERPDGAAGTDGPVTGAGGPYASVVFQHRYGSGAVHARELLRSGELGRPLVAHCQTTWYRDTEYYSVPWRGRWATEGGGPTMGHGIHQMDLLLHLLGDWDEVRGMAGRLVHDIESEDVSTALVRFSNGSVATVVNSVLSPDEVSRIRVDCTDATVELTHLYGHTNDDWTYTPAPHVRGDEARTSHWAAPAADRPSSHAAQLEGFLDAMEKGVRPPGSGTEARRTLEFAAAVYKSAFTGAPVLAGGIVPGDPYYSAMHGGRPDRRPDGGVSAEDEQEPAASSATTHRPGGER